MRNSKDGETARQSLAARFTYGDEAQLNDAVRKAQWLIAVKTGDIAELRILGHLDDGMIARAQDNVSDSCLTSVESD